MKKFFRMLSVITVLLLITSMLGAGVAAANRPSSKEPYGVFLSIGRDEMSKLDNYETVVIDAQYFTADDIKKLHNSGHTVYTYINIGSIEDFRDYYNNYEELFLGDYEDWEEEKWLDVSDAEWQRFMVDEIAAGLVDKGVDGFWVDNCDVYYFYQEEGIYNGLVNILSRLMDYDKKVIINSGDTFLDEYYDRNGCIDNIITGINQETVFSSIDFDTDKFVKQNSSDSKYYKAYIEKYGKKGADIYLLEYTKSKSLISKIKQYCSKKGCIYYVSDSIELD